MDITLNLIPNNWPIGPTNRLVEYLFDLMSQLADGETVRAEYFPVPPGTKTYADIHQLAPVLDIARHLYVVVLALGQYLDENMPPIFLADFPADWDDARIDASMHQEIGPFIHRTARTVP